MKANDRAWNKYFEQTNALNKIQNNGFTYITASDLKNITNREPRHLAKQDTLSDKPKIFTDNDISIFPVKNGEYILFKDSDNKSYFEFNNSDFNLDVETHISQTDLNSFATYPGAQNLNESRALDFAFISSLIKSYTKEHELYLALRGRYFSTKFVFTIPYIHLNVDVSSVQIEVDAGFESEKSIYLIEAKIGKRDNFHIRQLYYPFLDWSQKTQKNVIPIFLIYSNSKYYLYEFSFSQVFGELNLIRKNCFSVNESPIAKVPIDSLLEITPVEDEPSFIPFPQADDLDKVIDSVSAIHQGNSSKYDLANYFEFDERQGDYYGNAARYLGLVNKEGINYVVSVVGASFLNIKSAPERTGFILKRLLLRPTFREVIKLYLNRNQSLDLISKSEVANIIRENTNLTSGTPARRASTVMSWLNWITQNIKII